MMGDGIIPEPEIPSYSQIFLRLGVGGVFLKSGFRNGTERMPVGSCGIVGLWEKKQQLIIDHFHHLLPGLNAVKLGNLKGS